MSINNLFKQGNKRYILLLSLVYILFLNGCASSAFTAAKEKGTVKSIDSFLQEYSTQDDYSSIDNLMAKFSDDKDYINSAKKLREKYLFNQVKRKNTMTYYNQYIREYPNGKHIETIKILRGKKIFQTANNTQLQKYCKLNTQTIPYKMNKKYVQKQSCIRLAENSSGRGSKTFWYLLAGEFDKAYAYNNNANTYKKGDEHVDMNLAHFNVLKGRYSKASSKYYHFLHNPKNYKKHNASFILGMKEDYKILKKIYPQHKNKLNKGWKIWKKAYNKAFKCSQYSLNKITATKPQLEQSSRSYTASHTSQDRYESELKTRGIFFPETYIETTKIPGSTTYTRETAYGRYATTHIKINNGTKCEVGINIEAKFTFGLGDALKAGLFDLFLGAINKGKGSKLNDTTIDKTFKLKQNKKRIVTLEMDTQTIFGRNRGMENVYISTFDKYFIPK